MSSSLCKAIREQRVVQFYYDGYKRVVEPYCYGVSTAGNDVVRGYQVGGLSKSGRPLGWRLFRVDEMSGLTVLEATFRASRTFYNQYAHDMTSIYCRV